MDENDTASDHAASGEDALGALRLSATEARVLGCLVEKESTTPDQYPLTVNGLVSAANQKTSREPVMSLTAGEVGHALRQLESRGIVKQIFASRADRWEHRMAQAYSVTRQQQALLALLMLRGAQTLHELWSRSERLASFANAEEVSHALSRLAEREPAFVTRLPRASGQREDRYVHLLGGPVDVTDFVAAPPVRDEAPASSRAALEARIAELEARIAVLEARLGVE